MVPLSLGGSCWTTTVQEKSHDWIVDPAGVSILGANHWNHYLRNQWSQYPRNHWNHDHRKEESGTTMMEKLIHWTESFFNLKNNENLSSGRQTDEIHLSSCSTAHPSVLGRLVMLFYRYMLPHFTSEAYSWADPENRIFWFQNRGGKRTFMTPIIFSNHPEYKLVWFASTIK